MAYQKNKRKLNNRQTVTTSTTSDGSVRKTYTTKNGNTTRSQSINKDGSIRTTFTEYRQGGWVDRKTYTTPKPSRTKMSGCVGITRKPRQKHVRAKKGDVPIVLLYFAVTVLVLLSL